MSQILVINRVRVLGSGPHTPTQFFWEYPPPPGTDIHILTKMVMTSDETQIQIPANWPMSHAKRVTRDNWKNPEYHVIAALSNLRTDTNCPAGKSWPNHVKNATSWPGFGFEFHLRSSPS